MGEYVARHGQDHFDLSLQTLAAFTSGFSSEFDVRPFLDADLPRAMGHVTRWAQDENEHLRRLASEGTRPRLPWGMQLKGLIADPAPILPVLDALRDDPSEYVRRSVANNLNDIAKDHPDLVARIAADWLVDASPARVKLVRHACRTLIKVGHPGALAAFGYHPPKLRASLAVTPATARMGDDLCLDLTLAGTNAAPQALVVDYVLHYVRARGKTGPKVFKWTQLELAPDAPRTLTRVHKLREVTTRRHYPGLHRIEAQVNGQVVAEAAFTLLPETGTGFPSET
nr:DNA alkylation repair protein [Aliiroseovarius subalbicans]